MINIYSLFHLTVNGNMPFTNNHSISLLIKPFIRDK